MRMVKRWERLRVSARERQIHIGVTTSNVIRAMYTTMETPEEGMSGGCVDRGRGGGKCSISKGYWNSIDSGCDSGR